MQPLIEALHCFANWVGCPKMPRKRKKKRKQLKKKKNKLKLKKKIKFKKKSKKVVKQKYKKDITAHLNEKVRQIKKYKIS